MAMVIVILLNVLIAQLSYTYSEAKTNAKLQYAIDRMRIVTRLEHSRFARFVSAPELLSILNWLSVVFFLFILSLFERLLMFSVDFCKLNPLTPKISLVILLTVSHIVLVMLIWRIWYCIN